MTFRFFVGLPNTKKSKFRCEIEFWFRNSNPTHCPPPAPKVNRFHTLSRLSSYLQTCVDYRFFLRAALCCCPRGFSSLALPCLLNFQSLLCGDGVTPCIVPPSPGCVLFAPVSRPSPRLLKS